MKIKDVINVSTTEGIDTLRIITNNTDILIPKLAEKKAKRLAKEGPKKDENKEKVLDASKPITLDFLTNPNKE